MMQPNQIGKMHRDDTCTLTATPNNQPKGVHCMYVGMDGRCQCVREEVIDMGIWAWRKWKVEGHLDPQDEVQQA